MTSEATQPADGRIRATFDGEEISCEPGASVAAALIATGKSSWRTTRSGTSRGVFCGIGVCFDCLVEIDGESGQRACMIPLSEGMEVQPACGPEPASPSEPAPTPTAAPIPAPTSAPTSAEDNA